MVCIWSALIFVFFFGFRGFICDDWISYYPAFEKCSYEYVNFNIFEFDIKWGFEPGFTLLMCMCKSIVDEYQFFVFTCTLINTALLFKFLYNYIDNVPFGVILFISFGGFVMSTNLMRNSIAILIFVNSLTYIVKRKIVPYFLLCVFALSFHISAIIYFPLYFFFHKKCNKWLYLILFLVGNIVFLFQIPVFLKVMSLILMDSEGRLQ